MASAGRPDIPDTAGGRAASASERVETPAPEAGQHSLGPQVVGQRVVVRRLVRGETGPTGGPAFTDVLGTCLSWAEGWCVVQPDSPGAAGAAREPVRIAIGDIVSGKPVPPRPSVRHRVDPATAQRRAMALFGDLQTEPVGDWVLRHSPTTTARRANSVLAFGPAGVAGAYERVVEFYAGTTGRPIAAVLPGSAEEELFRRHGWGPESGDADTVFSIAGVARALRAARSVVEQARSSVEQASPWASRVERRFEPVEMTQQLDSTTLIELTLTEHDTPVASGIAAYADDWVGVRGVEVDPAHRRRGLGVAVMAELLEWGAEQGATTAYLQVIGDNEPALALYERLGFTEHHRYRYLAAR